MVTKANDDRPVRERPAKLAQRRFCLRRHCDIASDEQSIGLYFPNPLREFGQHNRSPHADEMQIGGNEQLHSGEIMNSKKQIADSKYWLGPPRGRSRLRNRCARSQHVPSQGTSLPDDYTGGGNRARNAPPFTPHQFAMCQPSYARTATHRLKLGRDG